MAASAYYKPQSQSDTDDAQLLIQLEPPMQRSPNKRLGYLLVCVLAVAGAALPATYTAPNVSKQIYTAIQPTLSTIQNEIAAVGASFAAQNETISAMQVQLATLQAAVDSLPRTRRVIVYDACAQNSVLRSHDTLDSLVVVNTQKFALVNTTHIVSLANSTAWQMTTATSTYTLNVYSVTTSNPIVTYCFNTDICHPCSAPTTVRGGSDTGFRMVLIRTSTQYIMYLYGNGYSGTTTASNDATQLMIGMDACAFITYHIQLHKGLLSIGSSLVEVHFTETIHTPCNQ